MANTVPSVSHTADVARIAGPVLVALLLAGCAAGGSDRLHTWSVAAPYLPPPSAQLAPAQQLTSASVEAHAPAPKVAAVRGPIAPPSARVAPAPPRPAGTR